MEEGGDVHLYKQGMESICTHVHQSHGFLLIQLAYKDSIFLKSCVVHNAVVG